MARGWIQQGAERNISFRRPLGAAVSTAFRRPAKTRLRCIQMRNSGTSRAPARSGRDREVQRRARTCTVQPARYGDKPGTAGKPTQPPAIMCQVRGPSQQHPRPGGPMVHRCTEITIFLAPVYGADCAAGERGEHTQHTDNLHLTA
ncbi:hypothetical protein Bbelb_341040 [Branchiostoma belcheri]|nr:hypothetical protein Bbelb_341040 [Branchiostoma belcheri]